MTSEIACSSTKSTSDNKLFLPKANKAIYTSSLEQSGPLVWNQLQSSIHKLDSMYSFKKNFSKCLQPQMAPYVIDLRTFICECCIVERCLPGSNSGRRQSLILFGADRHHSTWSRFSWSDIGYYHIVWMAVSLKIISCSSYFIFMFIDFSDAFVFRRGRSLRWISKIFNQLIFSRSDLFFFQSIIAYVVLFCCRDWNSVIQIRKLEYFTHLSMYVLRFMCNCILWKIIHLYFYGTTNEPIFYILYFYAYMMTSYKYCALWHLFIT